MEDELLRQGSFYLFTNLAANELTKNLARACDVIEERKIIFREARSAFKREIKVSQSCFKELCRKADADPWGNAYRVVTVRIRGPATRAEMCPVKLKIIVDGLFPQHDSTTSAQFINNEFVKHFEREWSLQSSQCVD